MNKAFGVDDWIALNFIGMIISAILALFGIHEGTEDPHYVAE